MEGWERERERERERGREREREEYTLLLILLVFLVLKATYPQIQSKVQPGVRKRNVYVYHYSVSDILCLHTITAQLMPASTGKQ